MSSSTKRSTTPVAADKDETGIECSPGACASMCGACLMFLMSLACIAALGVIAGGSFWTAQSMYRLTDDMHHVRVHMCSENNYMNLPDCGH